MSHHWLSIKIHLSILEHLQVKWRQTKVKIAKRKQLFSRKAAFIINIRDWLGNILNNKPHNMRTVSVKCTIIQKGILALLIDSIWIWNTMQRILFYSLLKNWLYLLDGAWNRRNPFIYICVFQVHLGDWIYLQY